jgi:hypothetical protein
LIVEAQLTQIGEFHNPDKKTSHPAVKTKVTADERGGFPSRMAFLWERAY